MEPEAYGPEIADFNQHHDPNDQVLSLPLYLHAVL